MTCQQCKYEWCWVCLRAWKGHADFFNCDKHEKDLIADQKGKKKSKRKKIEEEREKRQEATKRYLQYRERFDHHEEEQKKEAEIKATAVVKIQDLQDVFSTKPEVQFIDRAVTELQECRSVLKYTYVFAYYLFAADASIEAGGAAGARPRGAAKDLFEMLQSELEKTTERLLEVVAGLLIRHDTEAMCLKMEAINHTNLARARRENLLQAVARDALFEGEL